MVMDEANKIYEFNEVNKSDKVDKYRKIILL